MFEAAAFTRSPLPLAIGMLPRERRDRHECALQTLDMAPRPATRGPYLMVIAYGSLLDNLLARGFDPPGARAGPSRMRLLGAFLQRGLL